MDEFLSLADDLRPSTEQAMKIEVAPWIKDYICEMDELYSEITLEKIKNTVSGYWGKKLSSYQEMFTEDSNKSEISYCKEGKRVLGKGDPGMGKTTLAKKIGWDWAKGIFEMFSIVFFVFLKLVRPNDVIENVIIQQTPKLEGLGITKGKLRYILERFGGRCLLILDGLDEHALGENKDVMRIIKGQRFLKCNILVTSRPHSTREIQQHFQTIVRVDGFTHEQAKKFAFKILQTEKKVFDVLHFNPADFRQDISLYKCPILLSFLCLLVREEDIDLLSTAISTGQIYTRMIRCLYKKFIIRRGIDYEHVKFEKMIVKVGKLAFDTLMSGNPLLRRSQVIEDVGTDAFDYGLLIGHEDFRLIKDETADIFITFPHRSIQEFLGAHYFITELNDEKSIESLLGSDCKEPIVMMNPLFLHFCLWFLYSDQKYFRFQKRTEICNVLEHYAATKIMSLGTALHIDVIAKKYPAIYVEKAYAENDKVCLAYLRATLAKCSSTASIVSKHVASIDWVLTSMQPGLKNVIHLHVIKNIFVTSVDGSETRVQIRNLSDIRPSLILKHCQHLLRKEVLYVQNDPRYDQIKLEFALMLNDVVKKVHVSNCGLLCQNGNSIPQCPSLTHLILENQRIPCSILQAISAAVQDGKLPHLSHLCFIRCSGIERKLPILFESTWHKLTHLNLYETLLDISDFRGLFTSTKNGLLPKLSALVLCVGGNGGTELFSTLECTLPNLTSLFLDDPSGTSYNQLQIIHEKLPNLTSLGISVGFVHAYSKGLPLEVLLSQKSVTLNGFTFHASLFQTLERKLLPSKLSKLDISFSRKISGNLSVLLDKSLPSLNSLILRSCGLNSKNLHSLAQASKHGRLPVLRHLDISRNDQYHLNLNVLFEDSCTWDQLISLNILGILGRSQLSKQIKKMKNREMLCSLRELFLSGSSHYKNWYLSKRWPLLETLHLYDWNYQFLADIIKAVDGDLLPSLLTVRFYSKRIDVDFFSKDGIRKLEHAKIYCVPESLDLQTPTFATANLTQRSRPISSQSTNKKFFQFFVVSVHIVFLCLLAFQQYLIY